MAVIRPFKGFRYSKGAGPIEKLVSPPYDQFKGRMRADYGERSKDNIVHVILPDENFGDGRYKEAAKRFRAMIAQGALQRDGEEAFYIYEQESRDFAGNTMLRTGFVGCAQVEEFSARVVFPHEQTFPKHKKDRLELLRTCHAHFGQIFMLYEDEKFEVGKKLDAWKASHEPVIAFNDDFGVTHRMWEMSGPQAGLADICRFFADKSLFIADGHHRYETALNFSRENRDRPEFRFCMMTFVNLFDKGLVILPTHRVLSALAGFDPDAFLSEAEKVFDVEKCKCTRAEFMKKLSACGRGTLGAAFKGGRYFLLTARPEAFAGFDDFEKQVGLDVLLLHRVVIEGLLKVGHSDRGDEGHIEYIRNPADVEAALDAGADVAFLLNPTGVGQVRDMILNARLMPHKSTDFYPKLFTGLVLCDLEAEEKDAR